MPPRETAPQPPALDRPPLLGTLWLGLLRLAPELPGPLALSEAEEARWRSFGAPRRAAQYRAGRWLLRRVAGLATGLDPEDLAFNASGRPRVRPAAGGNPPWLSLSHSGDWVLAAACGGPCGVDLERLGTRRDWPGLARYLGLPGGDEAGVLRHWTLKEALFKAVRPAEAAVWRFETPDYLGCVVGPPGSRVELRCFDGGPGFTLAPDTPA